MKHHSHTWYTRQGEQISGPFSTAVVRNKLLQGRLTVDDEVSEDQHTWHLITLFPELLPEPAHIEAQRTKFSQDERGGFDRRQTGEDESDSPQRRRADRRAQESDAVIKQRQLRTLLMQRYRHRREKMFWPLLITFLLLFCMALLAIVHPTLLPNPKPNCAAPAGPNVNWDNCLKSEIDLHGQDLNRVQMRNSQFSGANLSNASLVDADMAYANLSFADLSYSNLQHAILMGANLKQADLSNTNLSGANLSYADLTSAKLQGADLSGAKLDRAIWVNGLICAPGSVGKCLPTP